MLEQSLLWSRTIGNDGYVESEPIFLGAVLIGIAFFGLISVLVFLAL